MTINVNAPRHACPKLNGPKTFELARERVEFQLKQGHTESVTGTFLRAQHVALSPVCKSTPSKSPVSLPPTKSELA